MSSKSKPTSHHKTKKANSKHKEPSLLDQVKKGKYLAKGMMGTVYLASDKAGNKYAYKIGKMLAKDVRKSLNLTNYSI